MCIASSVRRRWCAMFFRFLTAFAVIGAVPTLVIAQSPAPQGEGSAATSGEHAGHDMTEMAREGSGTAWLPDESPMYALHAMRGPWTLMFHENVFLQYFHESGPRGDDQVGSINWFMGMAQRNVGAGRLSLRGMFSLEPWSIRGCGYPDVLASGEQCNGQQIHDHQHPHDLFMELAAVYSAPLSGDVQWQVYAAPAGEPALGPVAFPHRLSAMPNPLAPITHHWFDSTHITFGVVTGGLYGRKWKAEASVFNGREPDENRTNFDFAPLDSVSARFWYLPTSRLALQVSTGHLKDAEAGETPASRITVNRVTASATYHRPLGDSGIWASTLGWGRNAEPDHASNALLLETSFTLNPHDTWFGRFEWVGKSAHDLDAATVTGDFTVGKLQGGYTRYLAAWNGFQPGVGAGLSVGIVPDTLKSLYGSRINTGIAAFLTLRPAAMTADAHAGHAAGSAPGGTGMVMVQTSLDPSRLTCSPPADRSTAAKTTYEGKTYYFCSVADRDKFLTDPKISLSMMPPK